MRSAKLEGSKRLQRVLLLLADGGVHTTRNIIREADVCAVNSCISELRDSAAGNGFDILCEREGKNNWQYQLSPRQVHMACNRLMALECAP